MAKTKQQVLDLQAAYKQVFNLESEAVKTVLEDLAKFCRANETCFNADPRIHAVLEGRREVFLRLMEQVKLTPDHYWEIRKGS